MSAKRDSCAARVPLHIKCIISCSFLSFRVLNYSHILSGRQNRHTSPSTHASHFVVVVIMLKRIVLEHFDDSFDLYFQHPNSVGIRA